jgi:segregation and condensation protein A
MMAEDQIGSAGESWAEGAGPPRSAPVPDDEALIVDVGGFEGPLDLLLELARQHKVDLAQISILKLADQYLAYIEKARRMRLELAADYLVMAAWLAYLKSRLLLPRAPGEDTEEAEDPSALLAFRLRRLQAMRDAAANLMSRNLFGRDVFGRGDPEPLVVETQKEYADNLVDLLKAYAERRQRAQRHQQYTPKRHPTFSIKEARQHLERLVGRCVEWTALDGFIIAFMAPGDSRRSALASSFTASLELAREGTIEIRQDDVFAPLYVKTRQPQLRAVAP